MCVGIMQVFSTLKEILDKYKNFDVVLTLGNFDGVHKGHQHLIEKLHNYKNCKKVVVTFTPHPRRVLNPNVNNWVLMDEVDRYESLFSLNIDALVAIKFTRDFSDLTTEDFLEEHIFTGKNINTIIIGHDFNFGKNKEGNYLFLKKKCEEKDINCIQGDKFQMENVVISSSLIRNKLSEGKVEEASKYLGQNYYLRGKVDKGDGRGKKMGIPTANLFYDRVHLVPKPGVYATSMIVDGKKYSSVTNIGFLPTFKIKNQCSVETHLLNFNKDIYGKDIKLIFHKRIRDEKRFSSAEELIAQIKEDIDARHKIGPYR